MERRHFVSYLFGAAAIALCVGSIAPSGAVAQGAPGGPAATTSHQRVDDVTIKKAATVSPRIRAINEQTRAAVQKAANQQQRTQIISHARDEQLSVLRDAGITLDQYEKVLVALNSDPSVRAKFRSYMGSNQAK